MDIDPVYDPSPIHDKYLPELRRPEKTIAMATLPENLIQINRALIVKFRQVLAPLSGSGVPPDYYSPGQCPVRRLPTKKCPALLSGAAATVIGRDRVHPSGILSSHRVCL
jgi:hypothetical protein